ncbi:MAG: ribose-5-phosphate isomerase RpiA [Bacteroidetes bacterium]|nr:ribose 5-phosphate isomerase A [Rhodothermaceae bacterium RA]RMH58801.1 MAG: ribose-5-phosphate isomerase RpiA [Bacteroidota bacterium]
MTTTADDIAKQAAGEAAARLATDGMCLGLGTGSTTAWALAALGRRVQEEGLRIRGVPTSFAAERLARRVGIPLTSLDAVERLDLALDGADEVSPALDLIKGRGAAHTREKVVAAQADRFVVLVDPSKLVDRLGTRAAVPVEVLPMATSPVMRALERLGGAPELRMGQGKDGPVVTDQGFWVVDVRFADGIDDPVDLGRAIKALPGVLDHGLFLGMATEALIGRPDGTVERLRPAGTPAP